MWTAGLRFQHGCSSGRPAPGCVWLADAHADLAALMALAELVRDALSDRFAPSNARLSGASNLSRDQNRGEVNATADEADAGDAARRNKSTCSQENPGRRPAARQRGLGCRQRHKPR
jgi:hypothetical protein